MTAMIDSVIPQRDRVELRMSAHPENLALARLALSGIAASVGASEEVIGDLKLAVTEACTNAMQHAYADRATVAQVVVRYGASEGVLRVEVEDFGAGFDPSDGELSTSQIAAGGDRGMGLKIMKAVTDELTVTSTIAGTRVVFAKRFDAQE
jgi:serine/threonine-protein kinase RsbW